MNDQQKTPTQTEYEAACGRMGAAPEGSEFSIGEAVGYRGDTQEGYYEDRATIEAYLWHVDPRRMRDAVGEPPRVSDAVMVLFRNLNPARQIVSLQEDGGWYNPITLKRDHDEVIGWWPLPSAD